MTSVSLNPRTEGFPILEVIRWTGGITARLILMLEELSEKIEVTCLELLFVNTRFNQASDMHSC